MAGNDAMLIGRRTYDEFASFWPSADPDDPYTAQMNGTRKYVVSTTLTSPEWENCTVVSGDVRAELARLKQDNNLGTTGSHTRAGSWSPTAIRPSRPMPSASSPPA